MCFHSQDEVDINLRNFGKSPEEGIFTIQNNRDQALPDATLQDVFYASVEERNWQELLRKPLIVDRPNPESTGQKATPVTVDLQGSETAMQLLMKWVQAMLHDKKDDLHAAITLGSLEQVVSTVSRLGFRVHHRETFSVAGLCVLTYPNF